MTLGDAMAVLSVTVAFGLYRIGVAASRRRDIGSALAILRAVNHAMVGRDGEHGWGVKYFANRWTPEAAAAAGSHHARMILNGSYEQVLVVPTEPLAAVVQAHHTSDLISEETIYAANLGLWHIAVFNQLVEQHTLMQARSLLKLSEPDTTDEERRGVASAIGVQAEMLHRRGVGEPNEPGGWFRRLRDAVDANTAELARKLKWYRAYGILDYVALLLIVAALALVAVEAGNALSDDAAPTAVASLLVQNAFRPCSASLIS